MATDSIREQVLGCIQDALAAIREGEDYFYSRSAASVIRAKNWADDRIFNPSFQLVEVIRAGRSFSGEGSGAEVNKQSEIHILTCKKDPRSTTNPFEQAEPITDTIDERLMKDVEKAIRMLFLTTSSALWSISGVENLDVVEQEAFPKEGWSVVETMLVLKYRHDATEP